MEKYEVTLKRAKEKVPGYHLQGLGFRFEYLYEGTTLEYSGCNAYYSAHDRNIIMRPLKTLSQRTVLHEIGHHVYNNLSQLEREKWSSVVSDVIPSRIPSTNVYGIKVPLSWRIEEYFAELYVDRYGGRVEALVKLSNAPKKVRDIFNKLVGGK